MRKQLCPSNKSLKLDVLKWIAISSKEGRIWAAKYNICVVIRGCFMLHSNPER